MSAEGGDAEAGRAGLHHPHPGAAGMEAPSGKAKRQPVVLRVELATKRQAQVMQWVAWLFLAALVGLTVGLVASRASDKTESNKPRGRGFHIAVTCIAAAAVFAQLVVGAVFFSRVQKSKQHGLKWSRRHVIMTTDATVTLILGVVTNAFWLAAEAAVVGSSCVWPYHTAIILAIFRGVFVFVLLFWLVIIMHSMCRFVSPAEKKMIKKLAATAAATPSTAQMTKALKLEPSDSPKAVSVGQPGKGTPTASPSDVEAAGVLAEAAAGHQLVVDLPFREQLWIHKWKLLYLVAIEGLSIANGIVKLNYNKTVVVNSQCIAELKAEGAIPPEYPDPFTCSVTRTQRTASSVTALVVFSLLAMYIYYLRRAFKDHATLPYSKYKATNLYIRVQARNGTVILATIVVALMVDGIAVATGSCFAYLEGQLGFLPAQLALTMLVLVSAVLYMPRGGGSAAVLQSWLQEFAWVESSVAQAKANRNQELSALYSAVEEDSARKMLRVFVPHAMRSWEQTQKDAAEELAKEPMFCMETACRLFYWARLAYAVGADPEGTDFVKTSTALELFGLSSYEVLREESSETLALVGWGGPGCSRIVITFRGTANMKNVATDLKFIKTPHLPERRFNGSRVLVHSGFYNAWRHNGFEGRLLAKLEEIVGGLRVDHSQLTFYVTGHSLGGALANLGAFEVQRKWPQASFHVYTIGAPRLGNSAFVAEYNQNLPESWSIINSNDPIPRIPKGMYKRSGQRVTLNGKGDLLVRPSYFEMSMLTKAGGVVSEHMTGNYALALASIVKAQFAAAKSLPGGEEGARALLEAVDLGQALVLSRCDLASLQDPGVAVVRLETLAALSEKQKQAAKGAGWLSCCGGEDVSGAEEAAVKDVNSLENIS